MRNAAEIQAVRNQSGAFYVFNHPPHNVPPASLVNGQPAWLLDYAVRPGGTVVRQQLWFPQGQGDRRRYVEQARLHIPVFFFNANGSLGVPVSSAAIGDVQLHGTHLPPQLADRSTLKIRISVCTRFFTARTPSLTMCRSQWPGYNVSEHQVQLKDQTPQKNPITFDRFVKHVGSRVKQFLVVRLSSNVAVDSEIDRYIGLRARSCPPQ